MRYCYIVFGLVLMLCIACNKDPKMDSVSSSADKNTKSDKNAKSDIQDHSQMPSADQLQSQTVEEPDVAAEYPGGIDALREYILAGIDPTNIDDYGYLRARVSFIVEKDGAVSNVKLVEASGSTSFDKEAVRAVKKQKRWKPATLRGENVRSLFTIPIAMSVD